jgi:hypothetical protein
MRSVFPFLLILILSFLFRHLFYDNLGFTLFNPMCDLQNTAAHPALSPIAHLTNATAILFPVWASRFHAAIRMKLSAFGWASAVVISLYFGFLVAYFLIPDQVLFPWHSEYNGYYSANRSGLAETFLQITLLFLCVHALYSLIRFIRKDIKISFSVRDTLLAVVAAALVMSAGSFGPFWSRIGGMEFTSEAINAASVFVIFGIALGGIRFSWRWKYGPIVLTLLLSSLPIAALYAFSLAGMQHEAVTRYTIYLALNILVAISAILAWEHCRLRQKPEAEVAV